MKARTIARIAHQAEQALCAAFGEPRVDWESLSESRRQTAVARVKFYVEHPDGVCSDDGPVEPRAQHLVFNAIVDACNYREG